MKRTVVITVLFTIPNREAEMAAILTQRTLGELGRVCNRRRFILRIPLFYSCTLYHIAELLCFKIIIMSACIRDYQHQNVLVGRGGSVVRACDWQSSGRGFESCWGRLETLAISFTPLCQCLSEETLKAVGLFYLVSMPGEVKYPTSLHWKCETYRGLHHPLLETTRHHGPHWK